jgi:hypothetical protein
MKTGIELIAIERQKQIDKHGFTGEHHALHPEWYEDGQLISAAHMLSDYDKDGDVSYLYRDMPPFNWDKEWWQRMCDKPKLERIIISGALFAAEIDRRKAIELNQQ